MEDDDDEEDFETLVYGQCEADQDAASRRSFGPRRRTVIGNRFD